MHVMLDLETFGNGPDAAIIALGAVQFDPACLTLGDTFYRCVDLETSVRGGGEIDPGTVLWWLKQSDEARRAITDRAAHPLKRVLTEFAVWIRRDDGGEKTKVWGNGAAFDNVVLAQAYRRAHRPVPWPYWNDRCYRTLKNLLPEVQMERAGTHHNALDDARYQARHLMEILHRISINQRPPRGSEIT